MHCKNLRINFFFFLVILTLLYFLCFFLILPGIVGYYATSSPGLSQISTHAVEEEVSKKADMYVENLQTGAEMCEDDGVTYTPSCKTIYKYI